MIPVPPQTSAIRTALLGLIGLAAAMGIGRFGFTPLLPLMQQQFGLSVRHGGYLASANYVGYLLGALACYGIDPRPRPSMRFGLLAVAASTFAMGLTHSFVAWMLLRAIAGIASAFVLVGISAWALGSLAAQGRSAWAGFIFAGVGLGICVAGLLALNMGAAGLAVSTMWLALGALATIILAVGWRSFGEAHEPGFGMTTDATGWSSFDADAWRLIACYGGFGFGYIIPATFLPALARRIVDDPAVFGWTWPVFGVAAAISAVLAATVLRKVAPRKLWAATQGTMAFGVLLPAIHASLTTLIVSAVCVGGTFLIMTMAAMQAARQLAVASVPRLMSAMAAAFATGQLVGPLTVGAAASVEEALRLPSLLASAVLFATAVALWPPRNTGGSISTKDTS
ncbi:MAG: YbfB/YjiJ family MFS transporter [Burkholderiales bacterium]|nr:YbfB/YjiJ family MFS transporter [Burkholderiales bacterium]